MFQKNSVFENRLLSLSFQTLDNMILKNSFLVGFTFFCFQAGFTQPPEKKKLPAKPVRYDFTAYRQKTVVITGEEQQLYRIIMEYRAEKNLPSIPLSVALTYVAQTHAGDLAENYQPGGRCNLNSWSKQEGWSSCCYLKGHSQADCMWNKPRELTTYPADGFEIVFCSAVNPTPEAAFKHWKNNPLNDCVIRNTGTWSETTWQAIGIGVYKNYITVWLGKEPDNDGEPEMHEEKK